MHIPATTSPDDVGAKNQVLPSKRTSTWFWQAKAQPGTGGSSWPVCSLKPRDVVLPALRMVYMNMLANCPEGWWACCGQWCKPCPAMNYLQQDLGGNAHLQIQEAFFHPYPHLHQFIQKKLVFIKMNWQLYKTNPAIQQIIPSTVSSRF